MANLGGHAHGLAQIGVNELLVVATGNEADLLRVWLLSHGRRQAVTMRQLAHLGLAQMTERKPGLAELFLSEAKEEITLIAGMVHAAQQTPALAGRVELNSRIITSSHGICAHLARRRQQLIKLQVKIGRAHV